LRTFESDNADIESCHKSRQLIIGVSANGTKDVRNDALNSGMCDFCPKPFSFDDLTLVQDRHKNRQMVANDPRVNLPFFERLN
jgi:DNA-binding response OmpR family regulator